MTEEFRFVKGKPKEDSSVSGMILFTIQMALTIVQTKVIPMAMFVISFPPVKMARGLFLDGLLSMMFYLPLSITRAVLVQLGLVKYIASWLEIDNRVTIVASNEEVQKEMEKMRIYIRDVNDVNTRLTTQKDFQNADFNRQVLFELLRNFVECNFSFLPSGGSRRSKRSTKRPKITFTISTKLVAPSIRSWLLPRTKTLS